jgi:acetyltransferase-like isoleucine patch superfamily enzyme
MSAANQGSQMPPAVAALVEALREAHRQLQAEMRTRWNRDLPIEELLFDRWERARSLGFGVGASIYHSSYVYGDVRVGAGTWIGPFTLLDGSGGLTIGAHCSISAGVQVYTHDTVARALTGGRTEPVRAPVSIGDCTYIGSQAVVAKGVTIGDHTVIGACSFVNRDVPPFTVAFGVPCRPVGRVSLVDGQPTLHIAASDAKHQG